MVTALWKIFPRYLVFIDSAINELWEGPRNVLMSQISEITQSAKAWYSWRNLHAADALEGANPTVIKTFVKELTELINHPSLFVMDEGNTGDLRSSGQLLYGILPCLSGFGFKRGTLIKSGT